MYIPGTNRLDDLSEILSFIKANSFAIVVSDHEKRPVVTHLPITFSYENDELRLQSHFAKANPQWETLNDQEVLVIFSGAHAYISPSHYDKYESVPTWNYVAVHAYGKAELVTADTQPERLEAMLAKMIISYEIPYLDQWNSLSKRYRDGMKQGIVGFEILVSQIQGKAKLSQNKSKTEQDRIANALLGSSNPHIIEVGYMMKDRLSST